MVFLSSVREWTLEINDADCPIVGTQDHNDSSFGALGVTFHGGDHSFGRCSKCLDS